MASVGKKERHMHFICDYGSTVCRMSRLGTKAFSYKNSFFCFSTLQPWRKQCFIFVCFKFCFIFSFWASIYWVFLLGWALHPDFLFNPHSSVWRDRHSYQHPHYITDKRTDFKRLNNLSKATQLILILPKFRLYQLSTMLYCSQDPTLGLKIIHPFSPQKFLGSSRCSSSHSCLLLTATPALLLPGPQGLPQLLLLPQQPLLPECQSRRNVFPWVISDLYLRLPTFPTRPSK